MAKIYIILKIFSRNQILKLLNGVNREMPEPAGGILSDQL